MSAFPLIRRVRCGGEHSDLTLESSMDFALLRLVSGKTIQERADAWVELKSLHAQRSAQQVAKMEVEQGLK